VLAIVELVAMRHHPPRASAGNRSGLEHAHPDATLRERHARRHPGVTAAHNGDLSGYALIHVFQAIQNLRSGVSEVRCVRTRKPSRSISSSSVR